MKRGFVVAIGGAALVIAGLSGCGSDDSKAGEGTTTTAATVAGGTAATGSGTAKVSIDGADQDVQGTVTCATMGGNVNIAIGEAATGIAAVVSEGDSPSVQSVGLGNVNGVTLGYQSGVDQGNAEASKDGQTYKITGTATGVDMANPLEPVNKPFEIEVTCP